MSAFLLLCSGHFGSFNFGELGWAVACERRLGTPLFYAQRYVTLVLVNELFTSLHLLSSYVLVGENELASNMANRVLIESKFKKVS